MAAQLIAGQEVHQTASTSLTPAIPAGMVEGDYVLLFCALNVGGGVITPPIDYLTLLDPTDTLNGSTSAHGAVFYKKWVPGDADPTVTFTSGRAGVLPCRLTGADVTDLVSLAPVVAQSANAATTVDAPSVTPPTTGLLVTVHLARSGVNGVSTTWTAPAGMTEIGEVFASTSTSTNCSMVVSTAQVSTPGVATGIKTATPAPTTTNGAFGVSMVLKEIGAVSAPAVLNTRIVGIPTRTQTYVSAQVGSAVFTPGQISVRLKVGTNPAVTTGVVFGPSVTPNAQGAVQLTASGLTPGTRYYYRVGMTTGGTENFDTGAVGTFKTAPNPAPYSFAFNFGSCTNDVDSASMQSMAARGDDLFFHLGDLYYADGSGNTLANARAKMNAKISATNHQALFSTTPTAYTPSDHDGMLNNTNAGRDPIVWGNWNTAYRELFPTPRLADGGPLGVYYTFTWGRVRFIQLDTRSFATIPSAPDNAAKTRLGAKQKQWFKDQITAAVEPLIVILNADPWSGNATAGDDSWLGATVERTELANFITASGKNVAMLMGDIHVIAAGDGTGSPGGLAVFCGSPFNNQPSTKGGPYVVGPYPSGGAAVQQYGHMDVTDSGSSVTLAFTGLSADGTVRGTLSKTYPVTNWDPGTVPVGLAGPTANVDVTAPAGTVIAISPVPTILDGPTARSVVFAVPPEYAPGPAIVTGATARIVVDAPEGAARAGGPSPAILAGQRAILATQAWPGYVTPDKNHVPVSEDVGFDITVYDKTYRVLGRIGDYISASVTWTWLAVGTGEVVVPADHWVVPYALTCNTTVVPLVIEVNGIRWTGRVAQVIREHGADGGGTATLTLVDDWAWLQSVLAWPVPSASITAQTNATTSLAGKLATIACQLINDNMARLQLPVLALAPITDTSADTVIEARMAPLADYLVPLFQLQNWSLSATLWLPGDPQPIGYVVPVTGSLANPLGTLSTPVVLFTASPNQAKPWVRWDDSVGGVVSDSVGVADPKGYRTVLAGSGQGSARIFSQFIDTVLGNALGIFGFPEVFAEVSQGDTLTEVTAQGPAEAVKNIGTASVSVTVQDGVPWRFGHDYFIGDMPRVELSGIALDTKPVTSVTATDDPDTGLVLVPTIGDSKAAASSDAMIVDVVQRIAEQLRRLQTGK